MKPLTEIRELTDAERVVGYILLQDAADYLHRCHGNDSEREALGCIAALRLNLISDSTNYAGIEAAQTHVTGSGCSRWQQWEVLAAEAGKQEVRRG